MNEKINNLIKQSYVTVQTPSGEETTYFSQEKFAELIVRECMEQCVKVEEDDELTNYEGGFRDGALLCYQEIKQHFGVEE